jgi:outer membrane protein assembly factor BamB
MRSHEAALPLSLFLALAMSGCQDPATEEEAELVEQSGSEMRSGWQYRSDHGDWLRHSFDFANTNANTHEHRISNHNVSRLQRAWQTLNDSSLVPTPPPSGFVLEDVLGWHFPASVVGVVSPPIVIDGTIYYIDELGTMFARDAKTGAITDPGQHWTTTLVDPDYDAGAPQIAPDLFFSAMVVDGHYIWIHSSFYGRLHAVRRAGGTEVDFDPATPGIQPFIVLPDRLFSSSLGQPVVVRTPDCDHAQGRRTLFITETNVILNDALVQGSEVGHIVAIDITDPLAPFEAWRRPTIDIDPATGLRYGAGVSAGSGLAVDFDRHLIIGGTGQNTVEPYPGYPDPALAPAGYVDRSDAIYAIDYRTGEFEWVNQLHRGDVFNLNAPVPTGPNDPVRDADVLSPPILFSARTGDGHKRDLVGGGSKSGLYRVVDRSTGDTVWERQIGKGSGLGGIQGGAAVAEGAIYVAGFEGIDDAFANANFNTPGAKYFNAFFATFSPAFWADVEDVSDDGLVDTGMQIRVYRLDAGTGRSEWLVDGNDHVLLKAGAALRHVSWANDLVYVTSTSGQLFVLDDANGEQRFTDQTLDLNAALGLGLPRPHHAGMNAGTIISNGMVYVPYGGQNNPSGGIIAYRLGH